MARATLQKTVYEDPPRKQVMLLTCMDQRLLDNIVHFMNQLNLTNRYDQIIFAGAAMGARLLPATSQAQRAAHSWKAVFFEHLAAAIDVLHRDIKDVFLLEHLDCGAYKYLHPKQAVKDAYSKEPDVSMLKKFHRTEALLFAKEVEAFCKQRLTETGDDAWKGIRVRCLVMDLAGHVTDL